MGGRHDQQGADLMETSEPKGGDFAEGEETLPKDEHIGSFAEGEETLPEDDRVGSFADEEDEHSH
jgi:hypothetical protein